MFDLKFESEIDDSGRIRVPDDIIREIPPHSRVTVEVKIPSQSNGTLDYYMKHPLKMSGVLPFDREAIYKARA